MPPALSTMASTVKPSIFASGRAAATRASMRSAAASTAAGVSSPSATPPTSDLWVMSGDRIFSATGRPSSAAALRGAGGIAGDALLPAAGMS